MRILLAAVLLLGPGWAQAQEEKKSFTIPFELLATKHMAVQAKINGKGPYRLIFDTGAPDSLLSTRVAKDAGLKPAKGNQPTLPIFGARGQYDVDSLELGELKAEKLSAMIMNHPTVEAIAGVVGPIEGIVGSTFFARYRMTIDYEAKTMTFEPGGYQPPDVMQQLMKRMLATKKERSLAPVLAPSALLGLRVAKADDGEAGVMVEAVLDESPAAMAGLKVGDRLLRLDGRWTDAVDDVYQAATRLTPGQGIEAQVDRKGKKLRLTLTPRAGL